MYSFLEGYSLCRVSRAYYFPREERSVSQKSREKEREGERGGDRMTKQNTTYFTRQSEIRHVRMSFALYIYYRFAPVFLQVHE